MCFSQSWALAPEVCEEYNDDHNRKSRFASVRFDSVAEIVEFKVDGAEQHVNERGKDEQMAEEAPCGRETHAKPLLDRGVMVAACVVGAVCGAKTAPLALLVVGIVKAKQVTRRAAKKAQGAG